VLSISSVFVKRSPRAFSQLDYAEESSMVET